MRTQWRRRPENTERQRQTYEKYKKQQAAYQRARIASYRDGIERVYFIHAVGLDRIKIGYSSRDPRWRLHCMETGSPDELRLLGWVRGTRTLEMQLHDRFAASRVRREWFQASPELWAYIAENACKNVIS
jgi:hypothetical protein